MQLPIFWGLSLGFLLFHLLDFSGLSSHVGCLDHNYSRLHSGIFNVWEFCEYSRSILILKHIFLFLRIFGRYYNNLCDLGDAELPFAEAAFPIIRPDELEGLVASRDVMAVSFKMGYL